MSVIPPPPPPSFSGTAAPPPPPPAAPSVKPNIQAQPTPAEPSIEPNIQAQQTPTAPPAAAPAAPPAAPNIQAQPTTHELIHMDEEPGVPLTENLPDVATPGTGLSQVPVIDWTGDMKSIAAVQGFGDLDFTAFGIFPTVTLTNDLKFTLSTGGDLGSVFVCQIHEGRKKYLYSNGLPMGDKSSEVAYSYDQKTSSKDEPLDGILSRWRSQGWTPTMKTYMELVCKLPEGRVVLLSVPPSSISRFTAFVAETIHSQIPVAMAQCRVSVGEKVMNVSVPFHPMKFELLR